MRKSLTAILLLLFVCAMPLQAYAQGCAAHCALMQMDADDMSPASDVPGKMKSNTPCAQMVTCQLADCTQLSMLPQSFTGSAVVDNVTPSGAPEKIVPDRALSPLDRPPIFS